MLTAELFGQQHYQLARTCECVGDKSEMPSPRYDHTADAARLIYWHVSGPDAGLPGGVKSAWVKRAGKAPHLSLLLVCVMNRRWPSAVQLLSSFVLFTCAAATTPRLPTTCNHCARLLAGELLPMLTFFRLLVSPLQGLLRFVFAHVRVCLYCGPCA